MTRRGFTFLEVLLGIVILGIALVTLSAVIARDMAETKMNAYHGIAQAAAARLAERYAYYEGFDTLDTERQNNPTMPITVVQPTDPADLVRIPWRRTRRYIERYNGNPNLLRLTVVVDIANSEADGLAGHIRSWRIVTLVPKHGFDKSL